MTLTHRPSFLHVFLLWLFCILLFVCGCASIPRESVELSKMVGTGIGKSRTAHLATLDAFYKRLKADNDAWVLNTFLPRAIGNAKVALIEACKKKGDSSPDCSQLQEGDVVRLVKQTTQFRDELQAALEKNRDDAFRLVNDHYADLDAANAGVTGLLASAVDVKDATREAFNTFSRVTGIEIDTDAIEKAVDAHLQKAGQAGALVSSLDQQLSEILKKNKKKPGEAQQ